MNKRRLSVIPGEAGIFGALLISGAVLPFASPAFLTGENTDRQFAVIGIIAVGMIFAMVAGGTGLSVGLVLAVTPDKVIRR